MCYPQQEFFSKRPSTELQADGEVVGRKSTGERDGRQRRQGITTSIGTPKKEPRPHIVSVDERRSKSRMLGRWSWRGGRDQHVHLAQGLQELLAQEDTRFEGAVIHFCRHQGGSLEPCARGTIEFGSTGP